MKHPLKKKIPWIKHIVNLNLHTKAHKPGMWDQVISSSNTMCLVFIMEIFLLIISVFLYLKV